MAAQARRRRETQAESKTTASDKAKKAKAASDKSRERKEAPSDDDDESSETATNFYGRSPEEIDFMNYLANTTLNNAKGKGKGTYPVVSQIGAGESESDLFDEIEERGEHANWSLMIVHTKEYEF